MSSLRNVANGLGIPLPDLSRVRLWRELAAMACLGMSLSWTVPWFRSLSQATYALSSLRVFSVLGLMGVAAYSFVKGMVQLQLHVKIRQRVMIGLLIVSMLIGLRTLLDTKQGLSMGELILQPLKTLGNFTALIPNEFLVIVAVLLVWRRGAALAFASISPQSVQDDFKWGVGAFFFFTLINTLVTGETVPVLMLQSFFLFGLLAMGMARIATLGELRGGTNSPFERRRILTLVLTTLAVVEVSYGIAQLMSGEGAAIPAFLLGLAFFSALLLSIPLLLLILFAVFWVIQNYQEQIAPAIEKMTEAVNNFLQFLDQLRNGLEQLGAFLADKLAFLAPIFRWFFKLTPLIRAVVLVGVVVLLIGLVLLTLYIRERRRRELNGEELEAVLSAEDFLKMLRDALRRRGQDAAKFLAALAALLPNERRRAAARIRQIYMDLLDLCVELHHPRPEAMTPLEFLPALERLFPTSHQDLQAITNAYVKVRYGELPETRGEVEVVESAWKRVKEEGEKRRKGEEGKRKGEITNSLLR